MVSTVPRVLLHDISNLPLIICTHTLQMLPEGCRHNRINKLLLRLRIRTVEATSDGERRFRRGYGPGLAVLSLEIQVDKWTDGAVEGVRIGGVFYFALAGPVDLEFLSLRRIDGRSVLL